VLGLGPYETSSTFVFVGYLLINRIFVPLASLVALYLDRIILNSYAKSKLINNV